MVDETPLPDFDNPPVVEVALGVQFQSLERLLTPHLGLLWGVFRSEFPIAEQYPPLAPAREEFGPSATPGVQIRFEEKQPTPRCWFLNNDKTELLQIQQDRFFHNWRKEGDDAEYPRYENIRSTFVARLREFRRFVEKEDLGVFKPLLCEATYVNNLDAGVGWDRPGQLGRVLACSKDQFSDSFLPEPEDTQMSFRFVIRGDDDDPIGRLHVLLNPMTRTSDGARKIQLRLMARTIPRSGDSDGIMSALDTGREWVVRGFASITSEHMHEIWGRRS